MTTILLIMGILVAGQEPAVAQRSMPDLQTCYAEAGKFTAQDPADFNAQGLGATCIKLVGPQPGDPA